MHLFPGRLRRVGNSLSVLVPKATLDAMQLHEGDEVEVALLPAPAERRQRLDAFVGSSPGLSPFSRERKDRY